MNKVMDIVMKEGKKGKGVVGVGWVYEGGGKVKGLEGEGGIMSGMKEDVMGMVDEKKYRWVIGDKI